MLKLGQLIATFWLDWLMVVLPEPTTILALPADTTPFVGSALTFVPNDIISEIARPLRAKRTLLAAAIAPGNDFLPARPTFSVASINVPALSFRSHR
jgi:hypothetical protein